MSKYLLWAGILPFAVALLSVGGWAPETASAQAPIFLAGGPVFTLLLRNLRR
jgi:hypothetical protein